MVAYQYMVSSVSLEHGRLYIFTHTRTHTHTVLVNEVIPTEINAQIFKLLCEMSINSVLSVQGNTSSPYTCAMEYTVFQCNK
jgi:hypothetical protein